MPLKEKNTLIKTFTNKAPTFSDMILAWAESSPVDKPWGDKFQIIEDLKTLGKGHSLVDVGPGDGTISHALTSYYKNFILIDSFKENLLITEKKLISSAVPSSYITSIQGELLDQNHLIESHVDKVDRILNIHNFYYLVYELGGQDVMVDCLKQNIERLHPGGSSFTVLKHPSEGGSSMMFSYFHKKNFELDLQQAAEDVQKTHPHIKVSCITREVESRCINLKQAVLAALLVLLHYEKVEKFDFTNRLNELMDYVITHFYKESEGIFNIPQRQFHLHLTKP